MFGFVLLYWIGKYFGELAVKYNKSKWGYIIFGIFTYYGGTFLSGILFVVLADIFSPGYIDTMNETLLGVLALPFGILSCYLLFKYLEKTWKKNMPVDELDQIGNKEA